MYYELAAKYTGTLQNYTPCASAADRSAWERLSEHWRQESISLGEQYLQYAYPPLSATGYMDFTRTGNRTRYEDKFFARRQALCALTLAECVEDRGRFTDDILNGIYALCEESGWQLPAHNSYIRDTPQLPLPDASAPVLDLFACETGAILATVSYLLQDKLNAVSPAIVSRIRYELNRRIFEPYLNTHFWWMGDGEQPMCNWTIWCTQNVLLSVFLTDTDPSLRSKIFLKACRSTDYFLDEYGEDGCCDEGAQYYRHAGLCLFHVTEILNSITGGAFASFYEVTKIQNIASYILNVHVDGRYYINFADCSPVAGRAGVREYLFAKRVGNNNMALFAARDFLEGGRDSLLMPNENNLYYRLLNGFTAQEITEYARTRTKEAIFHADVFYKSVGLFIARDRTFCLAVKAGDNADSHNHNDTGSLIVYKNGRPLLIDVGVESYTQKTFSPQRYEIWTMQSAYHNLPTVNGIMQMDGEAYHAKDVSFHMGESLCEISMDIADAYPKESGLLSYRRNAALHKGDQIIIQDCFALQEGLAPSFVVLSLMTYEKPVPHVAEQSILFTVGNVGTLSLSGGKLLSVEEIPVTDPRLQTAWSHPLYRILIQAECKELELCIQ